MRFQAFLPNPSLRRYVSFYWLLEPDYATDKTYRLLPGSGCDIILQIGPHAEVNVGSTQWKLRTPEGFVEGLFKDHFLLRFSGPCKLAGIRFASTGLYPFVKTPVREFSQQFVDLIDVFGKEGKEAIHRFGESEHPTGIKTLLDSFLLDQLKRQEKDDRLQEAVQSLFQRNGMISVHDLTRQVSVNERRLERMFDRFVGMSPERFSLILRLNHFIRLASHHQRLSFTQLAFECGFSDQSHLIRAFKRHTGLTPTEYFGVQHPLQFLTASCRNCSIPPNPHSLS